MEQKIHKPLWLVAGKPYLGRMLSYPIYLLIMFCSKLHLPNGHPVKHYLGNVNVREGIKRVGKPDVS